MKYDAIDKAILDLFQRDTDKAFRMLYDTYYMPLCLYSIQFTMSLHVSEDIVQNIYVDFYNKSTYKRLTQGLHAWLFAAVRFASITFVKRNHYYVVDKLIEDTYSPIDDYYDQEEVQDKHRKLLEELKELPEREYLVLNMIFFEGKKYKEAAEELGVSVNTVKTHLSRAMKHLRKMDMNEILLLFI